jgi:hypothetical protein
MRNVRLSKFNFALLLVGMVDCTHAQEVNTTELSPQDNISTFSIMLDTEGCDVESHFHSEYSEVIDSDKGTRTIVANNIPNHATGAFPNSGNPNTIKPQVKSYVLDLYPKKARRITFSKGMSFGLMLNGVEIDPYTNEFFRTSTGSNNRDWNINGLTSTRYLGTDCNNAHVQPGGKYHYHGTPNAYLEELGVDGTEMVKVGYAADGFPIYYKYGYDNDGALLPLKSGYQLKSGDRKGNGKSAPSGVYDGTYFQDYEYNSTKSLLDECNGRTGRTPDSNEEYYYVITDNFPSSPLCLAGTPSDDFKIQHQAGGNRPQGGRPEGGPGAGDRPSSDELMSRMDANGDGKLSKSEVRGPLQTDFDQLDSNGDGFLSSSELKNAKPPGGRPD